MDSKKRRYRTELMNAVIGSITAVFCYCTMMFNYSLINIGLQRISRTGITVSVAFFLSLLVFRGVYGPFHMGIQRKRQLLSNQFCKLFFSDLITYLMLQIMNTNPSNPYANPTFRIIDRNLIVTAIILLLQMLICLILVQIGYKLYYRINPPQSCLLIASNPVDADHLATRIQAYPKAFYITEAISQQCEDWKETILENQMICIGDIPLETRKDILDFCYENRIPVDAQANGLDVICSSAKANILLDTAFINYSGHEPSLIQRFIKRSFDIVFSILLLLLLSPLLLIITLVLALSHNGSVIFTQERRTKDGKIFKIRKFRTMYVDTAENVSMNKHDDRITPFGRFLRKYRLDELPQLSNIIKGEMSIVGPRPEMLSNIDQYLLEAPEFRYRERMKAGITGFAQLEGAYDTSPRDKIMLDLMYIEKFSLGLDAKLILRTFTVFLRKDAEGFSEKRKNLVEYRTQAKDRKEL